MKIGLSEIWENWKNGGKLYLKMCTTVINKLLLNDNIELWKTWIDSTMAGVMFIYKSIIIFIPGIKTRSTGAEEKDLKMGCEKYPNY